MRSLIRFSRPLLLLGGVLLYALGAGIARYLGETLDWQIYLLGQAWVILVQLGAHFLAAYYDLVVNEGSPQAGSRSPRPVVLTLAAASLTAAASLSVLLINFARPSPQTLLILVLAALGAVFYSVPPVRLAASGYGELTTAILMANLLPALAFLLQAGDLHRLVAMSTFPLTALFLASILIYELPTYAADVKRQNRNLMVRMGWQNGMRLHNALVVAAFFLLGLALTFGLPLLIALPVFIALPLGLLQIWQIRRIADGMRPNWKTLTINALALFFTSAYLLVFGFWTR